MTPTRGKGRRSSTQAGRSTEPFRMPVEELALTICERIYAAGGGCSCKNANAPSVCPNMLAAASSALGLISKDGWPKFDPKNRP